MTKATLKLSDTHCTNFQRTSRNTKALSPAAPCHKFQSTNNIIIIMEAQLDPDEDISSQYNNIVMRRNIIQAHLSKQ